MVVSTGTRDYMALKTILRHIERVGTEQFSPCHDGICGIPRQKHRIFARKSGGCA